jgi:hypothetical protein
VRRNRSTVQVNPVRRFRTRTTSPQGWAGRIRRTVGGHVSTGHAAPQVRGVAASADLADSVRTTRVQTRIPTDAAVAARGHGLGALADQRWATAPSTCSEIMPCGVVASIGSRRLWKCAPVLRELLDDAEQTADRAGEAVELDHDQGLAGSRAAGAPAPAGCDRRRRACVPRTPRRSRRRATRRAADRCPFSSVETRA